MCKMRNRSNYGPYDVSMVRPIKKHHHLRRATVPQLIMCEETSIGNMPRTLILRNKYLDILSIACERPLDYSHNNMTINHV
jgi:hypothetical protein